MIGIAVHITLNELYYCYELVRDNPDNLILNGYISLQWAFCQQFEVFCLARWCKKISMEIYGTIVSYLVIMIQYDMGTRKASKHWSLFE
ncbi:hypothetical protein RI129_003447 [Pyrocoelia pectoralis]|uniref:Uncharacterized protein n=1 Tax=Pyrocoelia pectoralis TaxID=417401 RepID=A0AAN7VI97_9COLE